jgi:hypothetical protein
MAHCRRGDNLLPVPCPSLSENVLSNPLADFPIKNHQAGAYLSGDILGRLHDQMAQIIDESFGHDWLCHTVATKACDVSFSKM